MNFKPLNISVIVYISMTLFWIGCLLVTTTAWAQISASEVSITTPRYEANTEEFQPNLGTYRYRVSWQGIRAAEAEIQVTRRGDAYQVTSSARTNSFIDVFYRLRYQAAGMIAANTLEPKLTTINHRENRRVRNITIEFLPDGQIRSERWGRDPKKEIEEFDPDNYTLDPFSAAFIARSLNWEVGDTKHFDTYNGRSRYLISLTAEDRIKMEINNEDRDVLVISPRVEKLTDPDANGKLRRASIFVTDDAQREIIEIQSEVFVGTVRTQLVSFTPEETSPGLVDSTGKMAQIDFDRVEAGED